MATEELEVRYESRGRLVHVSFKNGGTMVDYGQCVARGRADSREAPAHITDPTLMQSHLPSGLTLTWVCPKFHTTFLFCL